MTKIEFVSHKKNINELVNLFEISFGFKTTKEFWRWKYLRNPYTQLRPEVIVIKEGRDIIGARPLLFTDFCINNSIIKTAQPCDTMVHVDHRRKGLFYKMNDYAIDHYTKEGLKCFYNFPNEKSRSGYLKQGWRIVSKTESLFYPLNIKKLVNKVIKKENISSMTSLIYKYIFMKSQRPSDKNNVMIKTYLKYPKSINKLKSNKISHKFDINKNESYFIWRFDHNPIHSYQYIVAFKEDRICGYTIISKQKQRDNTIHGKIVDYYIENKNESIFIELMKESMIKLSDTDIIIIWVFSNNIYKQLLINKLFFKSPFSFPYNKMINDNYLVVRKLNDFDREKIDIWDKNRWNIKLGNTDTI
jgi:hypothetical protein